MCVLGLARGDNLRIDSFFSDVVVVAVVPYSHSCSRSLLANCIYARLCVWMLCARRTIRDCFRYKSSCYVMFNSSFSLRLFVIVSFVTLRLCTRLYLLVHCSVVVVVMVVSSPSAHFDCAAPRIKQFDSCISSSSLYAWVIFICFNLCSEDFIVVARAHSGQALIRSLSHHYHQQ